MSNKEPFYWLNEHSRLFLQRGYLKEGETAEERIWEICRRAGEILKEDGFAERFYDYMSRGWISLSSPIWANFGSNRGLPISCNGSYIEDTMDDIIWKQSEIGYMTKMGAGTSAYFGSIRSRGSEISTGGKTQGPCHFAELFENMTNIVSQSNVRRGSCAIYLDIEHPDIWEFLELREEGSSIQNLSLGVCVGDKWLDEMVNGDSDKRELWARIIKKRFQSGYPYIFFTDNVNNNAPQTYKDKNKKVHASNLCSEIALHSSKDESFVCDLSSLNILHFDEWKNSSVVEDLTRFLDAVMEEYIEKTKNIPLMVNAHNFAYRQRALGIGTLGYHSYLQYNGIPFESFEANIKNVEIHQTIYERSQEETKRMAKEFGEPPYLEGYGKRNVTTCAIAPTTSSSFILGQVSPSIEPLNSNYFTKDLAKGKFTYYNPFLEDLLEKHNKNDSSTWFHILKNGGSVQRLDFLTEHEKSVFKAFSEIGQKEVINQAASRQKYIDQSQSLNLMIPPETPAKDVNQLMIHAWRNGVKTLYYQRGTNPSQELARSVMDCAACES